MKCKDCKYYKSGLDINYIPGHYCDANIKDKENCNKYKEPYTILDYIRECWFGILFVIIVVLLNILYG